MLILGDLHLGNHRSFSTVTSEGLNSRLVDGLVALKDIANFTKKTKQETVILLGDVFDSLGTTVPKDCLTWGYNAIKRLADNCNEVIIISGNHDLYRGKSILSVFDDIDGVTIITKPEWFMLEGHQCLFIPFMRHPDEISLALAEAHYNGVIEPENTILFGHFAVKGAVAGKQLYTMKDGLSLDKIPNFKKIFLGHIHSPQIVGNVYYVGSILQVNSSEENDQKVMVTLDRENRTNVIKLGGPQFHTIEISKKNVAILQTFRDKAPNDYYTIILTEPVDGSLLPAGHRVRVIHHYDMQTETRLDMKKTESQEELLLKYMETVETKLNKNKLVELAMKIFEEVK